MDRLKEMIDYNAEFSSVAGAIHFLVPIHLPHMHRSQRT